MKLLLTSDGLTNNSIVNALEELVGGKLTEKNLTFVSTGSTIEKGDKQWFIDNLNDCASKHFKLLDIVDISAIARTLWQPRLEAADILLFCGGNSSHLLYWIKKSGLAELLPSLLQTRVYVGISAGTIVATRNLALSSESKKDIARQLGEYTGEEALGYTNIHIRPHYLNPLFLHAQKGSLQQYAKQLQEEIYAIDYDSAIKVVDDKIEAISEGDWQLFTPNNS